MESILVWLVTSLLGFTAGYIINYKKESKRKNEALKEAILALLWERLNDVVEKYEQVGYLPDHARNCLTNMFEQYKKLGGNHGMEILVEGCFKLPPIKKDRKNETVFTKG